MFRKRKQEEKIDPTEMESFKEFQRQKMLIRRQKELEEAARIKEETEPTDVKSGKDIIEETFNNAINSGNKSDDYYNKSDDYYNELVSVVNKYNEQNIEIDTLKLGLVKVLDEIRAQEIISKIDK